MRPNAAALHLRCDQMPLHSTSMRVRVCPYAGTGMRCIRICGYGYAGTGMRCIRIWVCAACGTRIWVCSYQHTRIRICVCGRPHMRMRVLPDAGNRIPDASDRICVCGRPHMRMRSTDAQTTSRMLCGAYAYAYAPERICVCGAYPYGMRYIPVRYAVSGIQAAQALRTP